MYREAQPVTRPVKAAMPWNPERYNEYAAERGLPFEDLFGMIEARDGMRVVDLGCGTGAWTAVLAERLPNSSVLGIDSSAEMLDAFGGPPRAGLRFEQQAIEDADGEWDLVFSQSALQWVLDHDRLIPMLFSSVAPGGQLAFQIPSLRENRAFDLIARVASEEPFVSVLGGWTRELPVLAPERYAELLWTAGAKHINVLEKVFPHVLQDRDHVADWMSGTSLVPYVDRLGGAMGSAFVTRYRERLGEIYPPGEVFFPFRRIFIAATRPGSPESTSTG